MNSYCDRAKYVFVVNSIIERRILSANNVQDYRFEFNLFTFYTSVEETCLNLRLKIECLQDVSDRVEKEEEDCVLVQKLEKQGEVVTLGDWRKHICQYLQEGLSPVCS